MIGNHLKLNKFFVLLLAFSLFSFHAESADKAGDDGFKVGYKKGFYLKSADERYSLIVTGRLQLRYFFEHVENVDGAADFDGTTNTFQVRRFYLNFSGTFFDPKLKYMLHIIPSSSPRSSIIGDAYLNYAYAPEFEVRAGSFKLQMNRQEYTSSGKQQFVDRSLANERFNLGRSIGMSTFGTVYDKSLEYYVFLANGRETDSSLNTINEMLGGARLVYNILGNPGYSESDIDYSQEAQFAIGAGGALYKEDKTRTTGQDPVMVGSVDMAYKYRGFSLQGEFFGRDTNPDGSTAISTSGLGGVDNIQDAYGAYLQAGYFIIPRHFEVAGRASGVVYLVDANDFEYTGGLNYFFDGHNLKLQSDYSWIRTGLTAGTGVYEDEHRIRLQATLSF